MGASASELRHGLHITNTDIGLLVAVSSLVGAVATLPFGVLADRVTADDACSAATIVLWGGAMLWSATATSFTRAALDAALPRRGHGVGRPDGRLARRRLVRQLGARPDLRRHPRGRVPRRRRRLRGHGQHLRALVAGRIRHSRPAGLRARRRRLAPAGAGARRQGRARARLASSPPPERPPRTRRPRRRPTRSGSRGSAGSSRTASSSSTPRRGPAHGSRARDPRTCCACARTSSSSPRARAATTSSPACRRSAWSSRRTSTGSTRRSRARSCSSSAPARSPASSSAARSATGCSSADV